LEAIDFSGLFLRSQSMIPTADLLTGLNAKSGGHHVPPGISLEELGREEL
jgi:hypothetical protein